MRILLPTFSKRSKVSTQSLIFTGVLLILTWSCKKEDPPTLTTLTVTEITGNTAQSGGNITDDGGASVTSCGVVWSTSENPTMNNKEGSTSDGIGDGQFVSNLTGLTPGTTYYVRAYAINNAGTAYGNQEQFTTVDLASVTTAEVTDITTSTATSGGNVTDDGGAEVSARGIVWGTSENPTVEGYVGKTADGSGTGSFISELTDLNPGTTYYIRAYATNLEGTSYGEQIEFSTNAELATVTTTEVTELTSTSAISGGNITNDGGADITARGVVYNTNETPTVETNEGITTDGTGTGEFTSSLNGLTPNTTYYVRAYAANSEGTAYGEEKSFDTEGELATVTTLEVSELTATSALSGGNVTYEGGLEVTFRGIVWSTSENPDIDENLGITQDGSGLGEFTSGMLDLQPSTTYFVRAYATNSQGTAYGEQVSFSTLAESGGNESGVLEVINQTTGKVWMDRNLGANRAATSSSDEEAYGDLFQWGRAADGHEKPNSVTTTSLAASDTPGHGNFILNGSSSTYDWRSPQNDNLWQGLDGINNPCPDGYRLPTEAEWEAERQSWNSNDATGAFASPLKLPAAGYRSYSNGSLNSAGSYGSYWASTVDGNYSRYLYFYNSNAYVYGLYRAYGYSVRCIKD